MAIRDTASMQQVIPQHRKQVRNFALIWTGLTLLIGAVTFIAIYAATGLLPNIQPRVAPVSITTNNDGAGAPSGNQRQSMAALPTTSDVTATDAPVQPTATDSSASVAVVAQLPATNTPKAAAQPQDAATQAATSAAPAGATPTLSAMQDTNFDLGIAVQDNPDPKVFSIWTKQASQELKLNWVKLQVVWRDLEKTKGNIDFGALDVELPMLSAADTKVLLSIDKAPDWARDPGAQIKHDVYDGPPSDPNDYARFVTAIIKRYPHMVAAIEVFNEVNLDREWSTGPQALNASRYVTLLQTAHDAIKQADPNILVISAALSPTGASSGQSYQDDFVYFQKLVTAGMLKYADCVGAHHNGYNLSPLADADNPGNRPTARFRGPFDNHNHSWAFKTTLEGYHKMITAAKANNKICVTEFGWPSIEGLPPGGPRPGFEFAGDNSLQDQATFINAAIIEMHDWGWVQLAFLFNLNYGFQSGFDMKGPTSDNNVYSILGPNFIPRPVWQKIQAYDFRDQARKATNP